MVNELYRQTIVSELDIHWIFYNRNVRKIFIIEMQCNFFYYRNALQFYDSNFSGAMVNKLCRQTIVSELNTHRIFTIVTHCELFYSSNMLKMILQ